MYIFAISFSVSLITFLELPSEDSDFEPAPMKKTRKSAQCLVKNSETIRSSADLNEKNQNLQKKSLSKNPIETENSSENIPIILLKDTASEVSEKDNQSVLSSAPIVSDKLKSDKTKSSVKKTDLVFRAEKEVGELPNANHLILNEEEQPTVDKPKGKNISLEKTPDHSKATEEENSQIIKKTKELQAGKKRVHL